MSWNVFTIAASGGSNANSGTSASVVYTSASAVWDGTSVLTVVGAGAVTVGDLINVNSVYVAQVTVASATSITLSTTAKYGTAPTAGTYTINDGGQWSSIAALTTIFGSTTVYNSTQICLQTGAGGLTLAGTTTWSFNGATTAPIWIRGYNTTVGDLDNGSTSLGYPTFTCGAQVLTFNGAHTTFSGVAWTGSRSAGVVVCGNTNIRFFRCRFATTSSNAAGACLTATSGPISFSQCYFTGNAANTSMVSTTSAAAFAFYGCYFNGAGSGTTQIAITGSSAANTIHAYSCTFYQPGLYAINPTVASSIVIALGNTFYSCGADSIRWTTIPGAGSVIANNLFYSSGQVSGTGYDVNNASGTNSNIPVLLNNDTYNAKTGHTNGFGDALELNPLTEGSAPTVSTTDLHLLGTANGAGKGLPGQWENTTGIVYHDVGAWQRQVTAGAGVLINSGLNGGLT